MPKRLGNLPWPQSPAPHYETCAASIEAGRPCTRLRPWPSRCLLAGVRRRKFVSKSAKTAKGMSRKHCPRGARVDWLFRSAQRCTTRLMPARCLEDRQCCGPRRQSGHHEPRRPCGGNPSTERNSSRPPLRGARSLLSANNLRSPLPRKAPFEESPIRGADTSVANNGHLPTASVFLASRFCGGCD